jgi:hypothetical protein
MPADVLKRLRDRLRRSRRPEAFSDPSLRPTDKSFSDPSLRPEERAREPEPGATEQDKPRPPLSPE